MLSGTAFGTAFVNHDDTSKETLNKSNADTESKTGCSFYLVNQKH